MSRLASLLAAVPEPLTDLAGILTAVGVIIGSIWTAGRVLLNAFDKRAREANEPLAKQLTDLSTDLNEHRSYVYYHLGPNGDAAVAEVAALFPDWTPGAKVKPGDVLAWDGTLVEVIQGHTTQADWTPDKVPALFRIHRTPEMTEWVAGIAVAAGERFTFGGATYEVVQAHTTQKGWEPDKVPSLWRKVV